MPLFFLRQKEKSKRNKIARRQCGISQSLLCAAKAARFASFARIRAPRSKVPPKLLFERRRRELKTMHFFCILRQKKMPRRTRFYVAVCFIHAFGLSCNKTGLPAGSAAKAKAYFRRRNCSFCELRSYSRSALKSVA